MNSKILPGLFAVSATLLTSSAFADGFYLSGTLGAANQSSSNNSGVFTSNFTTGTVTGVMPALQIPAGSPLGWKTEFDSDLLYSGAFGYDYGNLRVEVQLNRAEGNVNRHTGVNAAGVDLSNIDAGVLISGNVGDLGVTTANLVIDGVGEVETTSIMLNGFYDFDLGGDITPYVGFGIGNARTEASFAPSSTPILDDDDNSFSWQVILGADYAISDSMSFFGNFRYFRAGDAGVDLDLLPATLDIENETQVFEMGLRYSF